MNNEEVVETGDIKPKVKPAIPKSRSRPPAKAILAPHHRPFSMVLNKRQTWNRPERSAPKTLAPFKRSRTMTSPFKSKISQEKKIESEEVEVKEIKEIEEIEEELALPKPSDDRISVIENVKKEEKKDENLEPLIPTSTQVPFETYTLKQKILLGLIPFYGIYKILTEQKKESDYILLQQQQEEMEKLHKREVLSPEERRAREEEKKNEFLAKATKKKTFILNEFWETEKTYLDNMKIIKEMYHEPLKLSVGMKAKNSILEKNKISIIFAQFSVLYPINKMFFEGLSNIIQTSEGDEENKANLKEEQTKELTKLILEFSECFKLYSDYISKYKNIITMVQKERIENKRFDSFLKDISKKMEWKKYRIKTLRQYLLLPIQRIPRYKLFLESLIKNCIPGTEEHKKLLKSSKFINEINTFCNKQSKIFKSQEKMIELSKSLNIPDFIQPSRKLIFEEENIHCKRVGAKWLRKVECNCYLFTDLFIVQVKHLVLNSKFKKSEKKQLLVYVLKSSTEVGKIGKLKFWTRKPYFVDNQFWISDRKKEIKLILYSKLFEDWLTVLQKRLEDIEKTKASFEKIENPKRKKKFYLTKKSRIRHLMSSTIHYDDDDT